MISLKSAALFFLTIALSSYLSASASAEDSASDEPITPTRSGSLNMNRSKRIDVTFLPVKQV
jgi:hypothetical protein